MALAWFVGDVQVIKGNALTRVACFQMTPNGQHREILVRLERDEADPCAYLLAR